ncbi:molybdopterin-dependent oxidoreductase [Ensifer sp. 22564]|uniref:molybdopterin-dependent oxidoreductase n=1 Tax=Sinorhizobium/Ensifer group TaxID=227292 RepID=UPI003F82B6B7
MRKPLVQGTSKHYTAAHWGIYEVETDGDGTPVLKSWHKDDWPPEIGFNRIDADLNRMRVERPAVRRGWLDNGPGPALGHRGSDSFVEVDWNTALDLVAREVERVRSKHGNNAIFGGSYGWASAGRFHHSQSQVHRFLNLAGGYVAHSDTYSLGAGRVLMPHVVAPMDALMAEHTSWQNLTENTELFVAFGGVPSKNAQISSGGASEHRTDAGLRAMGALGTRFVNIGPVNDNLDVGAEHRWIKLRPNTDTAFMLALAHVLFTEDLWNEDFVLRYCTGFDRFVPYLLGKTDGAPKTPDWAAPITGVPQDEIVRLARDMATHRTMLNAAWALQRAAHGEQPFWMLVTLAAMLGQIGLPGGGFAVGYGTTNAIGSPHPLLPGPTFPQGSNPVAEFIPCARITDMLLNPGGSFVYNGQTHTYPDIRLILWAGGNPFHHHQDLARLSSAWQLPDTIIANEQFWTANAKMADIVLPATLSVERNDIGHAKREGVLVAMKQITTPFGEARSDFDIFRGIAQRLGLEQVFAEGRDEMGWLKNIYDVYRSHPTVDSALPTFEDFWDKGLLDFRDTAQPSVLLSQFRADPDRHPLGTPSGRIEIFSETIDSFGYSDCPGHPVWLEPFEWLGGDMAARWPLHLLSDQPKFRLHSQLDHGTSSQKGKRNGREQVYMSATDAALRGIRDGDLVEIYNDRGRCLATGTIIPGIMPGVIRLATGAWYDPGTDADGAIELHGNPNALTLDRGASSLSQGCSAQSCLADIRRYSGSPPPITAFDRPILKRETDL